MASVRLTENRAPDLAGDLVTHRKACWPVPKPPPLTHPTWVLATTAPLDETDDEQDQHQEGYGAHEPNEPALGGDVGPVVGVSCGEARSKHVKDFSWAKVRRER